MLRDRQNLWRRLNLLGDLLITISVLMAVLLLYHQELSKEVSGLLYSLTALIWAVSFYGPSGSYFYRMKSHGQILKELVWSLGKSFMAFTAIIFFAKIAISSSSVLTFFIFDATLLLLFRFSLVAILSNYRTRGNSNRNIIIVGTGKTARLLTDRICQNSKWGLHILGFLDFNRTGLWSYRDIPMIGHPDGLADLISKNQVDYVVIAAENGDLPLTRHPFAIAEEMGVTVCFMSDFYFHPISKATPSTFIDLPAVVYSSEPDDRIQLAFKEGIDWLGGLVGVILSIPIAILSALAIKIEDGGPILFKQIRSGKNGKPFTMYKFRTMVTDAEKLKEKLMDKNEMSGPVFKIKNDPRITRVGAFLRRTSIDELPQFMNVVRRDMSLVGPRPPLPKEVSRYDRWQRRKLSVRPGLTCLWQVNGRNSIDFEDWMRLDLEYIDNWSLWLDTKILLKTVPAVFKSDGAS